MLLPGQSVYISRPSYTLHTHHSVIEYVRWRINVCSLSVPKLSQHCEMAFTKTQPWMMKGQENTMALLSTVPMACNDRAMLPFIDIQTCQISEIDC